MSTDPPSPPDSNNTYVLPNLRALLQERATLPVVTDTEDYIKRLDPVLVLCVPKTTVGSAVLKMSKNVPGQHVLVINDLEDLEHFKELRDPKIVGFGDFGADMDYPNRLTELLLAELAVKGLTRKAVLQRGLYLSTRRVNLPKNARDLIKANPNSTLDRSEEFWIPHYLMKVQPRLILATVPAIFKISTALHHVETLTVASQIKDEELIELVKQFPYARISLFKNPFEQFVYGADTETQKEIEQLSQKDQLLYQEELIRLSSHHKYSASYPPFDPQTPKEPVLHGLQHLIEGYTHEQACRFLAIAKIQKSQEAKRTWSSVSRDHVAPTVPTVTGHYALYRITEQNENEGFHVAEAYHKNISEDEELQKLYISYKFSKLIDYLFSPTPHLYPGDTVAVKSVRRNDKTGILEVLQFHIIDRKISKNRLFMGLPNEKAVVLGFGASVDIQRGVLEKRTVYRGDLFVPESWSPRMCIGSSEVVEDEDGKMRCKQMPSIVRQQRYTVDESATQHIKNYVYNEYNYNEELLELVTVAGSTVAQTQRHGRHDGRLYTTRITQNGNNIEFSVETRYVFRWYVGTKVVLSLPGQADRMAIVSSVEQTNTENDRHKKVFKIRATLRPGAGNVDQKSVTVYQSDLDPYPCLELGYFQKLPEGSNGQRIIQALYGGPTIYRNRFDDPKELGSLADYLENNLNSCQAEYVYRLLGHAPITVGSFPFGSGKNHTVAWAAYLSSIQNPGSQHVLLAKAQRSAKELARRLLGIGGNGNYVRFLVDEASVLESERSELDISRVMVAKMIKMFKQREKTAIPNDILIRAAAYLLHHNHVQQEDLPELFQNPKTSDPKVLEPSYWIRKFFELFPPTIIICTSEDLLNPDFGPLENVETVQFEEGQPTWKIELVSVCQKWPNAKFGLMGDPRVHSKKITPDNEQVTYEMVPRALFPSVTSDIVYRGHPGLVNQVFGLQVRLEGRMQSQIRIHESSDFAGAVGEISRNLPVGASLGIIHLHHQYYKIPPIPQNYTIGPSYFFIGTTRDTVIISTEGVNDETQSWQKIQKSLYIALTTARREIIVVGNVEEMRKASVLKGLVEFVERNRWN